METQAHKSSKQSGWLAVLAGLFPFLIFGPVAVLLAYPYPWPEWRASVSFQATFTAATLIAYAVGFAVGWLKRFPLWSYPYTVLAAGALIFGTATLLKSYSNWAIYWPLLLGLLVFAVLSALLVFYTRRNLPFNDLFEDIRRDWTRLSLGLLLVPTALFGMIEHEEDPVLTIFVLGPVLVLALTALLALVVQEKKNRAAILAGGMLLMILVRLGSGAFYELIYWLLMLALVFMPYLIQRRFQAQKAGQQA